MGLYAGDFVIQALEGTDLRIVLGSRAAPHKPYTLDGSMRAEFTWYPGAATASIQMLGATEKNTTITGDWNDKFIKTITEDGRNVFSHAIALVNNVQAGNVSDLVDVFEDLRLSGRLLSVSWEGRVRHGILVGFKQTWHTAQQMEWEMEFGWSSRGEPKQPLAKQKGLSFDDILKAARKNAEEVDDLLQDPPLAFITDMMDTLVRYKDQALDALTDIEEQVSQFADDAVSPFETAQRTLAVSQTLLDSAQGMAHTIEAIPQRVANAAPNAPTLDMGTDLQTDAYFRKIRNAARTLALSLAEQRATLEAQTRQAEALATFTAQEDTDLRAVSQRYYGTPNQWRNLRSYNNLTSSRLSAGQLVVVPRLNTAGPSV